MIQSDQFLTVADAARILNVSIKTIRRRIEMSEIAAVRIGRAIRIHPKELQRYTTVHWDVGPVSPSRAN